MSCKRWVYKNYKETTIINKNYNLKTKSQFI